MFHWALTLHRAQSARASRRSVADPRFSPSPVTRPPQCTEVSARMFCSALLPHPVPNSEVGNVQDAAKSVPAGLTYVPC